MVPEALLGVLVVIPTFRLHQVAMAPYTGCPTADQKQNNSLELHLTGSDGSVGSRGLQMLRVQTAGSI
jgi:hypothetical protein